jgi:predicted ATP-binding protein involved in virulence
MSDVSPNKGVYFSELYLDNVKCFKQPVTLKFTDDKTNNWKQWTIILGDNGLGKTTILQCLAALEINVNVKYHQHIRSFLSSLRIKSKKSSFLIKARLSDDIEDDQPTIKTSLDPLVDNEYLFIQSKGDEIIKEGTVRLVTTNPRNYYVFSYGATRLMGDTSLSENLLDKSSETLFSSDAKLINAEEWLLQLDYAASKESDVKVYALNKREKVKKILIDILPDVTDIRFSVPTKENLKSAVEFYSSFGWVKIGQLSLGYKTMIAWVIDLAARMFARYPESDNPLAEPAIVLVDEIDLHLHPKWQRSIFEFLSDKFPLTQFIVTAHSPLIVQAAPEDVNLVVLRKEGDHVIIDQNVENVREWRIDQILASDLFGIDSSRNPEIGEWLEERKALLKKKDPTTAERERLRFLNEKAYSLPTAENAGDIEAMQIIRKAADYLKSLNHS